MAKAASKSAAENTKLSPEAEQIQKQGDELRASLGGSVNQENKKKVASKESQVDAEVADKGASKSASKTAEAKSGKGGATENESK